MDKGQSDAAKDNTEYVPSRCRITRPLPPKPATNPLQFVKVGPCGLYRSAQEQMKKVEHVKTVKPEIREEAEDWQQNLDNWKSNRRKKQEHIFERVVEVKKLEQEELERTRKKSKTFSEILEERNKRRFKPSITIYDDNQDDLNDLGISDRTSVDSSSDNVHYEQSKNDVIDNDVFKLSHEEIVDNNNWKTYDKNLSDDISESAKCASNQNNNSSGIITDLPYSKTVIETNSNKHEVNAVNTTKPMTYEDAIEDYRSRISNTKKHFITNETRDESTDNNSDDDSFRNVHNKQTIPKVDISKRKEFFETEKPEVTIGEYNTSRKFSEDFQNSQSIRERLLSLEKYSEQPLIENKIKNTIMTKSDKELPAVRDYVKSPEVKSSNDVAIDSLEYQSQETCSSDSDNKLQEDMLTDLKYDWQRRDGSYDNSMSPEPDIYVNKMNVFYQSLDNLTDKTSGEPLNRIQSLETLDYCQNINYPGSNSSTELYGTPSNYTTSDREDSGIHTADVSCSVSQADESLDDGDIGSDVASNAEKLSIQKPDKPLKSDILHENKVPDSGPIYSNVFAMDVMNNENIESADFLLSPATSVEPPKEKPPPPPVDLPSDDQSDTELKRLDSAKRIKKEIHIKRSSFLGLDQRSDDPELDISLYKPPDINAFLQKESQLEKQMYKKLQSSLSDLQSVETGDNQDSGVEMDRGRLSSDTWCSSLVDSVTAVHNRQDSEPCTTNSLTSDEDEVAKKEREIIELVEKEEKWKGHDSEFSYVDSSPIKSSSTAYLELNSTSPLERTSNYVSPEIREIRDSEVLKVERELLQLEKEELKRKQERAAFRESKASLYMQNYNKRLSLGDINKPPVQTSAYNMTNYRKSMPDLQHSAPYIQSQIHTQKPFKSELTNQEYINRNFIPSSKDRSENTYVNERKSYPAAPTQRPITRNSLQALSAAPRSRLINTDNWIHNTSAGADPKAKFPYNQHWLIQEAELRRIGEQQQKNWKSTQPDKHIPDAVIQTLTQRMQNRVNISDRNQVGKKYTSSINNPLPAPIQTTYRSRPNVHPHRQSHGQTMGHALPIYPQPLTQLEEPQDKMLSVSGKKKCSYCGNELGRGAAMIIESLCLFYHVNCFKCCVCHMQLGDGLMGTDVRVRNQKLHCHNCYSSDDGIKFSCV